MSLADDPHDAVSVFLAEVADVPAGGRLAVTDQAVMLEPNWLDFATLLAADELQLLTSRRPRLCRRRIPSIPTRRGRE